MRNFHKISQPVYHNQYARKEDFLWEEQGNESFQVKAGKRCSQRITSRVEIEENEATYLDVEDEEAVAVVDVDEGKD